MEESQIKNIWAHEHDRGPVLSTCTLQCFAIILPPVFTLKITLLSQPCLLGFWWDCLQSVCLHFFPSHSSRSLVCLRVCFLLSSTPLHTFYNNTTISSVAFHSSLSQFLSLQTSLPVTSFFSVISTLFCWDCIKSSCHLGSYWLIRKSEGLKCFESSRLVTMQSLCVFYHCISCCRVKELV